MQYPVYFIRNSGVDRLDSLKDIYHYESWIMYETDADEDGKMRAFDATYTLLKMHEIPWHGGQFELYIDVKADHSTDALKMKTLLIRMLVNRDVFDAEEGRKLSIEQLILLAQKHFGIE